ncbi:alpha/beta fold hydrolase [Roseobacter sp.]|uniref:alpha/beta fold hydrolase n=1 Tax=Roseobacter sp. TaxID=1907202 RepID=UPI00385F132A
MSWVNLDRVEADGVLLECATFGPPPGDAPTLVLLHEGLGCIALWRSFPDALVEKTGCGVFVYSRAGYGQSDPALLPRPLDYMTREAIEELPKVLNAAAIGRCILVGHSDGATIAAIYAGSAVDARVRGLVLMAPHFFTEKVGLAEIEKTRELFRVSELEESMAKYHRDAKATFRGWTDVWLDSEFKDWDVSDVIDYLRIPTLVIQGKNDQYGTTAQVEEVANRIYAPCDIEMLPDCKHSPHLDQPNVTTCLIAGFAQRLQRIENEVVTVV